MKLLYILIIYFSPYILIASQSMVSLLEESFYNETKRYVSKENVRERIEHLRKTGVLEGAMKKARETAEEMHRIGIQTDVIAQVLKVSLTQVEGWLQAGKM